MTNYRVSSLCRALLCMVIMFGTAFPIPAQTGDPSPIPAPTQNIDINESLARTLMAENERKNTLAQELGQIKQLALNVETATHTYALQLSTYNNLLMVANISVEELQKIQKETRAAFEILGAKIKEIQAPLVSARQTSETLYKQYTLNQRQLDDIQAAIRAKEKPDPQTREMVNTLEKVTSMLEENYHAAEQIQQAYGELLAKIEKIHDEFRLLDKHAASQIEERKKQELLERNTNIAFSLSLEELRQDMIKLRKPFEVIAEYGGLLQAWKYVALTYGLSLMKMGLFLFLFVSLLLKFRNFLKKLPFVATLEKYPSRQLLFHILERSFPYLGISICLAAYMHLQQNEVMRMGLEIAFIAVVTFIFYRWVEDILNFLSRDLRDAQAFRCLNHLRRLNIAIPMITVLNKLLYMLLGTASQLFLLERFVVEIGGLAWGFTFSKLVSELPPGHAYFTPNPKYQQMINTILVGFAYIISAGGILMELLGYAALVRYWYAGWLRTVAILIWGFLLLAVIHEWDQHVKTMNAQEQSGKSHQIEWLVFRLAWFLLPILIFAQLLIAWGEREVIQTNLLKILTYPISVGSMQFSVLRFVYGGIVLILVNFLVRLWRWILVQRIFIGSGLQKGIQASITTLSVYSIWLFGLMFALNVMGINTATLTVAFGALGIGIGFGLQSIFNNFISGLILLFERPIEVGHVLEVNGIWGQVETINVRSTVIRTFDNSAIIIPNSDIISHQVTNWTFQDARMRRAVKVGVTYGTDPKLVEQTLYEIAQKHPRILTDPAPFVHFSDFGEHALIFILRFWTLLDYGIPTETDIRVEIDRVFKEKQIAIAFPQLDVHFPPSQMFLKDARASIANDKDFI